MNNPETPDIYKRVMTPEILQSLGDEAMRRGMMAPLLHELKEEFEKTERAFNPVTEPTLLAKLYSLSAVQRTPLGVVGFEPSSAVGYDGVITAKIAPSHCTININEGNYRSRVINFTNSHFDDEAPISIFGINVYTPDMEEVLREDDDRKTRTLLVVDASGHAVKDERPVNGETLIIAVHSAITEDAKAYQVQMIDPDKSTLTLSNNIQFVSKGTAHVRVPDGQIVEVTQLDRGDLYQIVTEFEAGLERLKDIDKTALTLEEQTAAREVGVKPDDFPHPFMR